MLLKLPGSLPEAQLMVRVPGRARLRMRLSLVYASEKCDPLFPGSAGGITPFRHLPTMNGFVLPNDRWLLLSGLR